MSERETEREREKGPAGRGLVEEPKAEDTSTHRIHTTSSSVSGKHIRSSIHKKSLRLGVLIYDQVLPFPFPVCRLYHIRP